MKRIAISLWRLRDAWKAKIALQTEPTQKSTITSLQSITVNYNKDTATKRENVRLRVFYFVEMAPF